MKTAFTGALRVLCLVCVLLIVATHHAAAAPAGEPTGDATGEGGQALHPAADSLPRKKQEGSIRVLSLNLWHHGAKVNGGFDMIARVIFDSGADFVAMSESDKEIPGRLVQALEKKGRKYYSQYVGSDLALLSRYPIQRAEMAPDPKFASRLLACHVELPDGEPVIVVTAHLDYLNYATYLPRGYDGNSWKMIDTDQDGKPDPVVDIARIRKMNLASRRDESIDAFLAYARKYPGKHIILAGDFNECSHLDWTEATKNLQSHNGVVMKWRNSSVLQQAGFIDAYRQLYPNPVTHPGATWPSPAAGQGSTSWAPEVDERDRIDFVYYRAAQRKKALKATAAAIAGPRKYFVYNIPKDPKSKDPFVLTNHPWPSDHKGVLVDFQVVEE